MLISTLDGKLSALDVQDEGKLLWSVQADTRALLSSSISKLEVRIQGFPKAMDSKSPWDFNYSKLLSKNPLLL